MDTHPECYLDEFVSALARVTGVFCHPSTMSRILRYCLGYSLQVLQDISSQRNDILRQEHNDSLKHLLKNSSNIKQLIFIDETHKDRSSSRRRRGWGKRNVGGLIVNQWFREEICYKLIAAANVDGFVMETCVNYYRNDSSGQGASGTVGQEEFVDWIRYSLVPVLGRYDLNEENSIVVMDNASTHVSPEVANLIESVGAYLLYAAPYSPDLNPIEMMFHCCEMYLKRHEKEFTENHVQVHWNAINEITESLLTAGEIDTEVQ